MPVKMSDIARLVGVSRTTVSLVLNDDCGKEHRIAPGTVRKVKETAKELGYRPNRMSIALKSNKSCMVGILVGANNSLPSAEMIAGMTSSLDEKYSCVVANHYFNGARERHHLDNFIENRFEAIIAQFSGDPESEDVYRDIVNRYKIPMVLMETNIDLLEVPKVVSDHYQIAFRAVKAMNELGHSKILFASMGDIHINDCLNRQGYIDAMNELTENNNGYIITPKAAIDSWAKSKELLTRYAEDIIDFWQKNPYTSIISQGDQLGYEIMSAAHKRQIAIPDDFSLIGFGNHIASDLDIISLSTSCTKSLINKGKFIAGILLDLIDGKKWEPVVYKMPVKVILRNSTKKIQ